MSSRVTRSSARHSAGLSNSNATSHPPPPPPSQPPPPPPPPPPTNNTRKRKSALREPSPEQSTEVAGSPHRRRNKRCRIEVPESSVFDPPTPPRTRKGKAAAAMSGAEYDS